MRQQLETNGDLIVAMIAAGVLMIPIMGLAPLVGIVAACGTSIYIANKFNSRR